MYSDKSKQSLKSRSDEHKRSVKNCDCDSNSQNVASLNILIHDIINILYYEHGTDQGKFIYVYKHYLNFPRVRYHTINNSKQRAYHLQGFDLPFW